MAIGTATALAMGGGALLGAKGAHDKKNAFDKANKINAALSALDTQYSPFVKGSTMKQDVPDAGPGMFGGIAGGALSGFNQGQMIQKGLDSKNIYKDLLGGVDEKVANVAADPMADVVGLPTEVNQRMSSAVNRLRAPMQRSALRIGSRSGGIS